MPTFLAVLKLMGIMHKTTLIVPWSKENILAAPSFNQVIKRDRFPLLIRFL